MWVRALFWHAWGPGFDAQNCTMKEVGPRGGKSVTEDVLEEGVGTL